MRLRIDRWNPAACVADTYDERPLGHRRERPVEEAAAVTQAVVGPIEANHSCRSRHWAEPEVHVRERECSRYPARVDRPVPRPETPAASPSESPPEARSSSTLEDVMIHVRHHQPPPTAASYSASGRNKAAGAISMGSARTGPSKPATPTKCARFTIRCRRPRHRA